MDCQVSSEHIGEFKGSAAVHVVEVWGVHPDCDARDAMLDGIPGIEALKGCSWQFYSVEAEFYPRFRIVRQQS